MKKVAILVPETAVMEGVADPRYLFTAVNQFLVSAGKPAMFDVRLVGASKEIRLFDGLFSIRPDILISDTQLFDVVLVPPPSGDMAAAVEQNRLLYPYILFQRENGAEVASMCVGAFLLAATGLLDSKQCSTHWAFTNQFQAMFPEPKLTYGNIITEEHGIYTSGGANSYWNLLLYLVEKYTDREVAILAAKYFAIDIDRNSQSAFTIFHGQKNHNDPEIMQTQVFIEAHFHEKITMEQLADMVAIGRRSFERRFKKATNNTVFEYIQRVKIEAAKRSFESKRKNINEVMLAVGYTDIKTFRDIFKKITGMTPAEYRNKYHKQTVAA